MLLVEDNETDAELCIRTLKKHNLANNIVWVKDGEEALDFLFGRGEFAGSKRTSAKGGAARSAAAQGRWAGGAAPDQGRRTAESIPVVVLTSSKEDRDVIESYRLGANGFVSKPVEFNEFSDVVAKLGLYWLLVNKPPV